MVVSGGYEETIEVLLCLDAGRFPKEHQVCYKVPRLRTFVFKLRVISEIKINVYDW
jgi:hypothetical protein